MSSKKPVDSALGKTTQAVEDFHKQQLSPALEGVRNALAGFNKNQLGPGLKKTGEGLDELNKNQLGPAVRKTKEALDDFNKAQLGPAIFTVGQALEDFNKSKLNPSINEAGKHLSPIIEQTSRYVKENPGKSALLAGSVIALVAPGVVVTPVLNSVGFGSAGPIAGTMAPVLHSSAGSVAAGSAYSIAQSAAMGGYGAATIYGVVQAGAGATLAGVAARSLWKNKPESKL